MNEEQRRLADEIDGPARERRKVGPVERMTIDRSARVDIAQAHNKAHRLSRKEQDLLDKWVGAIGGPHWYAGPSDRSAVARDYGRALVDSMIASRGDSYDIQTSSGWFIYEVILPEVLRKFFSKNADYGDQHRRGLGLRAEFVGLHRKFAKLKSFFWDDKPMNHEGGEEMLYDVIGQCLLMLDLMAQEKEEEPGNEWAEE